MSNKLIIDGHEFRSLCVDGQWAPQERLQACINALRQLHEQIFVFEDCLDKMGSGIKLKDELLFSHSAGEADAELGKLRKLFDSAELEYFPYAE